MSAERLVLRGATVVDPRTGTATPNADVVVTNETIEAVLPGPTAPAGAGTQLVDLTGRYLVPGFEEMHAHPLEAESPGCYELMVVHGISGFRQMSGSIDLLRRRTAGKLGLPDLAPALREMPGPLMTPINAGTPEQAVAAVRAQVEAGADFIKSGMMTPETFTAAQREALRLGVPILGHLPAGLDVEAASRTGVHSIEHLGPGVPLFACCSTHGDHVRETVRGRRAPRIPNLRLPLLTSALEKLTAGFIRKLIINPANLNKPADMAILAEAIGSFDRDQALRLAERFVEDGTWNVPTLIRMKTEYLCTDSEFTESDELRFVSPKALAGWRKANEKYAKFSPEIKATFRESYQRLQELARVFDEAGVPMLTGSDVCGAGWMVPGFALHHEFDELAAAGLSPLRVLQMATSDAGDYLGLPDRVGLVAAGAAADLVVLTADPLESVENLHRIDGVVHAGRYLGRSELDPILARAEQNRPAF